MKWNLNASCLGIRARENEVIELALTYGFTTFDLDANSFIGNLQTRGPETATRFISSGNIKIGSFSVPVDLSADDAQFSEQWQALQSCLDTIASFGTSVAIATVSPHHSSLPYQENFERHRQRLDTMASELAKHGMRLAIDLGEDCQPSPEGGHSFIRSPEALIALMRTVSHEHIGICIDTWSWFQNEGTVQQIQALSSDKILYVRLSGVADPVEDSSGELVPASSRCLLSQNDQTVPTAEFRTLLDEIGFDGLIAPASHSLQVTGMSKDQVAKAAAKSLEEFISPPANDESAEVEETVAASS